MSKLEEEADGKWTSHDKRRKSKNIKKLLVFQWFWWFRCLIVVHKSYGKAVKKRRGRQTCNEDGFWIDFWLILEAFWKGKSIEIDPKAIEKSL